MALINPILKEKFPFVSNYFETLIENDIEKFPQSIVFEGLDIIGQYMFSTELARVLNCTENVRTPECGCINCAWIRDVKHPSVNIVSPINFKDDASKTVISINQAKKVTSSLRETSDYHRIFIFCDARVKQKSADEKAQAEEYKELGFNFPEEDWTPMSLNSKVFKAEASNSLLKSIEEPPKRTTFIFLTKNREDLISTIVSRSNVFKLTGKRLNAGRKGGQKGVDLSNILKNYPNLEIKDALEISADVEAFLKTENTDVFDFLNDFQEYILSFLRGNVNNNAVYKMFEEHIKLIQKAKKRLKASMSPKVVLESLFIDISQGNGVL